ncbi:uncharacterized protein LOC129928295 isoform X2 [Biomphalaria glabrata]|uniref:Uncharacterized protein LOC129928295 isoform X2 n=1 Tax=Biomphalaria glabrata TaxID=6526 RepID=A0A9W3BF18_BIOGL|nr:uncharacterized protein LOC129928295 isoform X2 [Biomphalaria glabrata]
MKSYTEVADIVSKVQDLDKVKIKKKCELWIEDKDNVSYMEIKEFICCRTSEILKTYLISAGSEIEKIAQRAHSLEKVDDTPKKVDFDVLTNGLDYQSLLDKFDSLSSNFKLQKRRLKKMQQKLKHQEKIHTSLMEKTEKTLESVQDLDGKHLNFKEELMIELHAASSCISKLETKIQSWSTEFKNNKEAQDIKVKDLRVKTEIIEIKTNKIENLQKNQQSSVDAVGENLVRLLIQVKEHHIKHLKKLKWIEKEIEMLKWNEVPEYFCEETGRSDVPCFEDCIHFIGHHEQQISEGGEADLLTHLAGCNKNPGHKKFIPIDKFNLKNLPQAHQNTDMYEFIKVVADLTVRITVSMTSPLRPEVWPDTKVPYFLYNIKESQSLRTGSGMVNEVIKGSKGTCQCETCQRSETPKQEWWTITVRTAANLIFDSVEGSYTTLRWFYDTEDKTENLDKRAVNFDVNKVIFQDLCWFDYITCDTDLVKKVEKSLQQYYYLYNKVNEKNKETKDVDKFMFIDSHPHGCSKKISFG